MKRTIAELSLKGLTFDLVEFAGDHKVEGEKLFINIGQEPINLMQDEDIVNSLNSRLVNDARFVSRSGIGLEIAATDNSNYDVTSSLKKEIIAKWSRASELFPQVEYFQNLEMYRSPKVDLGLYQANLWSLEASSQGRIHKEHDFREIHTQILGLGQMVKYYKPEYDTAYERVFMAPGFTHFEFFDGNRLYPWHSYNAVSDCIWLALERR